MVSYKISVKAEDLEKALTVVNTMYMDVNNRLYSCSKTVLSRVPQRDVGS